MVIITQINTIIRFFTKQPTIKLPLVPISVIVDCVFDKNDEYTSVSFVASALTVGDTEVILGINNLNNT